ncbi:MAG: O-antigen ligase family protein [Verrucomicrobiota bacterium]
MKISFRFLVLTLFLVGLFATGLMGTSASMTFIWPSYFLLGLAGALSVGVLFTNVSYVLPRWITLATMVLLAYLLVRAMDSPVSYFAREDVALLVASFLCYACILSLCQSVASRRALVGMLAALVVLNVFFAILQSTSHPGLWLLPGYERSDLGQVGGLFNQSDHFGIFLAALVPLWMSLALFGRCPAWQRILWKGIAGASIVTVLFSGGTAGRVVLLAGVSAFVLLTTFLLWRRFRPTTRRFLLVSIPLLAIGVVGLLGLFSGSLISKLGHGTVTRSGESGITHLWTGGLRQFAESPMIGTGSRSSYFYGRLFRPDELDPGTKESEFWFNEYIQMLGDYGIVGLFLLLVVLALHFKSGFSFVGAYRSLPPVPGKQVPHSDCLALVVGALAVIGALVVASGFDFVMHLPVFAMVAATMLAILSAPDPMANALHQQSAASLIPGGGMMFALRSVAFGFGLAMVCFGSVYSRSEYHYELARLAFEADSRGFRQFRHLNESRKLDPLNPFAMTLSAHAQVNGLSPGMSRLARLQALERAEFYFTQARGLYPQDVFSAMGHAAVLDELGKRSRARQRLEDAREWAPRYGNLMLAEAEHYLRHGKVNEAEDAFRESLDALAFRNEGASDEGLRTISEWKLMAQNNGLQWEEPEPELLAAEEESALQKIVREALVEERALAGAVEVIPGAESESESEQEESEPSRTANPLVEEIPSPAAWEEE